MTVDTEKELAALREIGRIVATVLRQMMDASEPGMTTLELDQLGRQLLDHHEANSAPKSMYDFPGYTCISVNEEAAHGIPGPRVLKPGDVVNIDVSAEKNGFFADTGGTLVMPPCTPIQSRLLHATRTALDEACNYISDGRPVNGIGKTIERVARRNRFRVIENLCGHGVGRSLHEEPQEIRGTYLAADKRILKKGQVIAIEPFLSTRSRVASETGDGWTLATDKGNLSAQFEHTIVVTGKRPILLTVA